MWSVELKKTDEEVEALKLRVRKLEEDIVAIYEEFKTVHRCKNCSCKKPKKGKPDDKVVGSADEAASEGDV